MQVTGADRSPTRRPLWSVTSLVGWHPVAVREAFQTIGAAVGIAAPIVAVARWWLRRRTAGPELIAMIQSLRNDARTAKAMGGATSDFYLDQARKERTESLTFAAKALANQAARDKILTAVNAWSRRAFATAGPPRLASGESRLPDMVIRQMEALDEVDNCCGEALEILAAAARGAR